MSITAQGYLEHLKSYLNMKDYGQTCQAKEKQRSESNQIVLSEKIEGTTERRKVTLNFKGDAFAIRLDQGNDPLYHFLRNNEGHLWSRRCDFIIFHRAGAKINAYCIEFKEASTRIPNDKIMLQLAAAEAWCSSLNKIVSAYIGQTKKINLSKYIFTACKNPDPDLDDRSKYLRKCPSIRHYLFSEIDEKSLEELENSTIKSIN